MSGPEDVLAGRHPVRLTVVHPVAPAVGGPMLNELHAPFPKPVACWRLPAPFFGFDSSLLLPDAAPGLALLREQVTANPSAVATIFGHADPVGDDDHNKTLSGRRARALYALLTRKVDAWLDLFAPTEGDRWGLASTQTMLAHLRRPSTGERYYTGAVDGAFGPRTDEAIRAFQTDSALSVDGIAGPRTRRVLYALYMDAICVGPGEEPFAMRPDQFLGDPERNATGDGKGAYQGCSELNPILLLSAADRARDTKAADKTARNAKNAVNRRLMVLFFAKESFPAYDGAAEADAWPCPAWNEGIAGCRPQLWPDGEARRTPAEEERRYTRDRRTMACSWYDRFARLSPCEGRASRDFCVRLHFKAEEVGRHAESLRLFSSDGAVDLRKEVGDALVLEDFVDVVFEEVPAALKYSLEVTRPGADAFLLFEEVAFRELDGFFEASDVDDDDVLEVEPEDAS